jgi:hypothetical protein
MAERDVEGLLRWGLACMSLAAAVIHASVAADHRGFPAHVAFFLVAAAVQSGFAAAVLRRPSGRWLAAIALANGAVAAVWVLSRTVGLPVEGATGAESIGFKDAICTLFEVGICAGAGLLGTLPEAARRAAVATGPLVSTVFAALVWGLGVSGVMARHSHDGHTHLHGGDVQAVADHHAGSGAGGHSDGAHPDNGHAGSLHHGGSVAAVDLPAGHDPAHVHDAGLTADPSGSDGTHHRHDAPTLAAGVSPVHRHGAAHKGPIEEGTDPHRHDGPHHGPVAPGTGAGENHDHGQDRGAPHDHGAPRGDGHSHDPGPEERPGGERRDPDEDRSEVGRLLDDVMRLVARR